MSKSAAKNAAATPVPAAEGKRQPRHFTILQNDFATGALFNVADEFRTQNGPIMSGSIDLKGGLKLNMSAFLKQAKETGTQYLSLSIGDEGGVHYYGKLFRKDPPADGSAPVRYSGFLTILPCIGEQKHTDEAWEAAPQLVIFGERRRNASGSARIALNISPKEVADDELDF